MRHIFSYLVCGFIVFSGLGCGHNAQRPGTTRANLPEVGPAALPQVQQIFTKSSGEAYASFLNAAWLEERGDLQGAAAALDEALFHHPN